jgi:hypothetical protein
MAKKTRKGVNATKVATKQNDTSAAPSCHHGSSEQEFNNGGGEYLKAVEELKYWHGNNKVQRMRLT